MKRLSVVVPAYNEAENLTWLVERWLSFCRSNDWDLIIVNDGSTDSTKEILDRITPDEILTVLHHKVNRGYGGAIKTGVRYAESKYVVTIDADGQHELESVIDLYQTITAHDADMVIGLRGKSNRAITLRNLGKAVIRSISKILVPNQIQDLNSGMKMYLTDLAKTYIEVCPDSMAFSDVIALTFISEGKLVLEYPITTKSRQGGKSTINLHSAFDTILEIVNIVMFFNPLRIFIPISLVCILAGLAWGLPIIIQGRGLSVGSLLAFIVGIIFILLGLVAEQLSQIRKMMVRTNKSQK